MPAVVIDGVEYAPKADVPELTDIRLKRALAQLTAIQYLREHHKAVAQAWNVLYALATEVAELSAANPKAAYDRFNS